MDFTQNLNLYKWNKEDKKQDTITEMSKNMDTIDAQLAETSKNIGSIEEYGGKADWDGTVGTDNSTAFTNSFNNGNEIYIYLPKGKYKTSSLSIPANKNVNIIGMGIDVTEIHCTGKFFTCSNTALFTTVPTASIPEGSRRVSLASAAGVQIGQLITFTSNVDNMEETAYAIKRNHSAIITGIAGNEVTFDRPVPLNFTSTDVTIKGYKVGKVKISNLTVSGEFDGFFGDVMYSSGFEVENVKIVNRNRKYQGETSTGGFDPNQTGGTMHGFRVQYAVDTVFKNPKFEYLSYGVMPTAGAVGVTLLNPIAVRCRHAAAPTGGAQGITVRDGKAYECYAGYDSHQTTFDAYHYNCHSYGDETANKFRGRYDLIEGCYFSGGFEAWHDVGLRSLAIRDKFIKVVSNTVSEKQANFDNAISVNGHGSALKGYVSNYNVLDFFSMKDSTIYIPDGSVISGYKLWFAFAKVNKMENVRIFGPYRGISQTSGILSTDLHKALYISRNDQNGTVELNNIEIDGFDYGVDFPTGLNLSKFSFNNIQIKNCVHGINNAANYKDNGTFNDISFVGCKTNIIEPFRFRFSSVTGKENQSFDIYLARTFNTNAMPTTGNWRKGDYGINTNPSELGTAGSKYIVLGWKRLTTGSGNVLNTDWLECRALTGN
ncbi:hypothetical protein [Bacillus sp. NTK034]|uniref:hypothetical protein n=1 Tax=Bacillus sp. NTK034 TaxID=2802176 RepID=UPI001A90957D|nr:hypothetical protein [Bacillus sp. NTK034]MBN8200479.1 hypothetical protein [Bacillus sp. NTK034]